MWYRTQKEHWLGWLKYYDTTGAYGRLPSRDRDARFAYNHIVEVKMLLWLIRAAGVSPARVQQARRAVDGVAMLQRQSAAVRRIVPWDVMEAALWPARLSRAAD